MKAFMPLLALALISTGAMAGDKHKDEMSKPTAATFKALDKDGDQRLSQTEAASDETVSAAFAAADTDSDGYLTMAEYTAKTKSKMERSSESY